MLKRVVVGVEAKACIPRRRQFQPRRNIANKIGLFFCGFLVVTPLFDASAKPVKRRDGGECDSVGTARKDATQDGKKVNCLFDTCTFEKCDTKGDKIGKCHTVIQHSNARDCKPVAKPNVLKPNAGTFQGTQPQVFTPVQPKVRKPNTSTFQRKQKIQ